MKYRVVLVERAHVHIESVDGGVPGGLVGVPASFHKGQVIDVEDLGGTGCRVKVDGVTFRWTESAMWKEEKNHG